MATFEEVKKRIAAQNAAILKTAPHIIAETATEYYKERFSTKEWAGNPWAPTKEHNPRGSLMVRSGALVSSIRPSVVSEKEVRISAGGPKVPYAKIHNEGGVINHPGGTAYTMIKKGEVLMPVWVSAKKARESKKKYPVTKPHEIPMPQRQFMGNSPRLNKVIIDRINKFINQVKK